jgi:hypothetical protein
LRKTPILSPKIGGKSQKIVIITSTPDETREPVVHVVGVVDDLGDLAGVARPAVDKVELTVTRVAALAVNARRNEAGNPKPGVDLINLLPPLFTYKGHT